MTMSAITRRTALLALSAGAVSTFALAGCGLSERPYAEQRRWPLLVPRPASLPPHAGGKIILVRDVTAGPGLESDGLQSLQADGSLATAAYERWAVPPAQGVSDGLRVWLAQSGKFAGVIAEGSRGLADIALEGELTVLWVNLTTRTALATMAITAIDLRRPGRPILLQTTLSGTSALGGLEPAAQVQAQLAALAALFSSIEAALPG
jgi:ABC-type uncharacterized transport system auxiliary subunit